MQDGLLQPNGVPNDEHHGTPQLKAVVSGTIKKEAEVLESPIQHFNELFSEIKNMDFPVYIDSDGWRINIHAIIYKNTKIKGIEIRRTKGKEREPVPTLRLSESWDSFVYYAPGQHYLNPEKGISEEDSKAIEWLLCAFKEHINNCRNYHKNIEQNKNNEQKKLKSKFEDIIKGLPDYKDLRDSKYSKCRAINDENWELQLKIQASISNGSNDCNEILVYTKKEWSMSLYYNLMDGKFYFRTSFLYGDRYELNEEETKIIIGIIKNIDNYDIKKLYEIFFDLPKTYRKHLSDKRYERDYPKKNPSEW